MDHVFTLAGVIERRKPEGLTTFCCFLDVRKAYDTVWREGLWQKVRAAGVGGKCLIFW